MKQNSLWLEVARLSERLGRVEADLQQSVCEYITGWSQAARVVGVTRDTVVRRARAGSFPLPVRTDTFTRSGETCTKPVWRRSDLRRYAEGGKVAEFAQMRTHLQ